MPLLAREELDAPYLDRITALTNCGLSALKIANIIGRSEGWVHHFRIRNRIMPVGRNHRSNRLPGEQRTPAMRGRTRRPPRDKVLVIIQPIRDAQRVSPTRRRSFDLEDTEEL